MAEPSAAALASLQQLDALKTSTSTPDETARGDARAPSDAAKQSLLNLQAGMLLRGGEPVPKTPEEAYVQNLNRAKAAGFVPQRFVEPNLARDVGGALDTMGGMARGGIENLAAYAGGVPEAGGNVEAELQGREHPYDIYTKGIGGVAGVAKAVGQGVPEVAPRIAATVGLGALGLPAPLAAGAPFAVNKEGFAPVQGAIMAAFPIVGKMGEAAVLSALKKMGVNLGSETALAGLKKLGSYLASEAYVQATALPEYLAAGSDEERGQIWAKNFALNLAFHLPSALGLTGARLAEWRGNRAVDNAITASAKEAVDQFGAPSESVEGQPTRIEFGAGGEKRNVTAPEGGIEDYRLQRAAPVAAGEQGPTEVPPSIGEIDQTGSENQEAMLPEALNEPAIGEEGPPLPEPEPAPPKPIENVLEAEGPMQQGRMAERLGVPLRRTRSAMTPVGPMQAGRMTETLRNQEEQARQARQRQKAATEPEAEKPNLFDQQDSEAEQIVHDKGWTKAYPRYAFEAAGDIYRELTKYSSGWFDPMYLGEKIRRLEHFFAGEDAYSPNADKAYKESVTANPELHQRLLSAYERLGFSNDLQRLARDLNLKTVAGDFISAGRVLAEIKNRITPAQNQAEAETGWTFKPNGAVQTEGLPPELAAKMGAWEFTDRRKGSPTEGLTVYVPTGSDQPTILKAIADKTAADQAAKAGKPVEAAMEGRPTQLTWDQIAPAEVQRDARFDDLMSKPELTFTELLQAIKEREPVYAELVDKLVKAGVNPSLEFTDMVKNLAGEGIGAHGYYTLGDNHVQLRKDIPNVAKVAMHEGVHAATLHYLEFNPEFRRAIQPLYDLAKGRLESKAYGLKNLHEFVAEAFTNQEFQKDLSTLRAEGDPKTLWQKFIGLLKQLFNIKSETVLERVLHLSEPYLKGERIKLPPSRNAEIEAPSMVRELEQLKGVLKAKEAVKSGSGQEFVRGQQASEIGVTPRLRAAIEKLQAVAGSKPADPEQAKVWASNPELVARRAIAQRVLGDRWVKRELVQSVDGVKAAAELLGGKLTTYADLKADPAASPEIKSRAALDALETSDGLLKAMGQFRAEYKQKLGQLETELSDVMEAKEWAGGKQGIVEVLTRELREVGKELAEQSGDAGAMKVYEAMGNRGQGVKNAVSFIAHYADFDLIQRGVIKNTKDLMAHLTSGAARMFPDQSMEQAVGAPENVIRYVAGLVMESEPLRESIFNGQEFLSGKAEAHPLQPFLGRIAEHAKAGNYVAALRDFQTGVGKTAVEADKVRRTARFFAAQEKRLVLKLATLHEVKALYDGLWSDPDFRSAQDAVQKDLNVQAQMVGLGFNDFILRPILAGDEPVKINFSDTSETGALEALRLFKDYKERAAEYLAHPEAPGFDPDKAAGLKTFLQRYELYANPTINPRVGRLMPGAVYWLPRTIFGLVGHVDQVPQVVLKYGGGFMADYASRTLNALLSAKEVGLASYKYHAADLGGALNKALASHGFDKSQLETWRRKVWNPLVGSRQYFENTWILESGSVIGNGLTVTGEDVAFLNAWRKFDKAIRRKLGGETDRALASLKNFPLLVAEGLGGEKVRLRASAETGPDTASRRMGSVFRIWRDWQGAKSPGARIDLINRNWDQLMLGYLSDSANPAFAHRYSFRDEVREVHNQGRHGQPASSFTELVDRVTGLYNAKEDREPVSAQDVGNAILKEFDGFFDQVRQEDRAIRDSKLRVKVFGGENSFNTERGAQVLPMSWYDYGSVTEPEHMAYVNRGISKFYVEHLNAVEALNGALLQIVQRFEQANRNEPGLNVHRTSIAQRIDGHDFYGWGDAKLAANQVGEYLKKLDMVYNVEGGTPIMEGHGTKLDTVLDLVVASLLIGPQANLFNSFGGFGNIVLHDVTLRNYGMAQATLRDFGHEGMRAFRELGNVIANQGNPIGRALIKAIEAGKPLPIFKQLAHWLELTRELYQRGREDAIVTSKELGKQTNVMWQDRAESGRNVEGEPGRGEVGKLVNSAETAVKIAAKALKEATVMFVDARINATAYRLVAEMEHDLSKRALKYGALRVQRAEQEGRDPYDVTDIQNLFSADELVKHPLVFLRDNEQQAARVREFLKRDAEINIDARMMDFYRRSQEAGDRGDLFTEAERNQLLMAIAGDINLATFGNRPIAARTSRGAQRLSLFLGYPAFQLYKIAGLFNHLHTQGGLEGYLKAAPVFAQVLAVSALIGMLGIGLTTAVKQVFMGKYGSNPTIFTASSAGAAGQAAGLGLAATIPFYGGIYNLVSGNAFKNGFDLNSQFVYANLATDAARMVKEIWQTGRADRPVINFARRWTFPANYLGQFVPQVAGLQEFSNARNILSRVAKDLGMESRLRKSFGAAGDNYGPTTPLLNDFANAVGRGDQKGIDEAWKALVGYYEKQGLKPEEARRRALSGAQSRNPIGQVFGTKLTDGELSQLYSRMTPRERTVVGRVLNNFGMAITGLGGKVNLTKTVVAPKGPRQPRPARTVAERVLGRRSRSRNPLGRVNRRLGIRTPKPAKAGTPNRRTRTPA